jgi:hypothetical protein
MNYFDDYDDDETSTSELRWTFSNFKEAVMNKYEKGKAVSGKIEPLGSNGSYWKVDFYPNGKDDTSDSKICFQITLLNEDDSLMQVDAECTYRISNRDGMKSYIGKIRRQNYYSFESVFDISFPTWILNDCIYECVVIVNMTQYTPFMFIDQQQHQQQLQNEVFYEEDVDYNQPIHISSIYQQSELEDICDDNYDNLPIEQLHELLKAFPRY